MDVAADQRHVADHLADSHRRQQRQSATGKPLADIDPALVDQIQALGAFILDQQRLAIGKVPRGERVGDFAPRGLI